MRDGVLLTAAEQENLLVGGAIAATSSSELALDISVLPIGTYEFVVTATNKQVCILSVVAV